MGLRELWGRITGRKPDTVQATDAGKPVADSSDRIAADMQDMSREAPASPSPKEPTESSPAATDTQNVSRESPVSAPPQHPAKPSSSPLVISSAGIEGKSIAGQVAGNALYARWKAQGFPLSDHGLSFRFSYRPQGEKNRPDDRYTLVFSANIATKAQVEWADNLLETFRYAPGITRVYYTEEGIGTPQYDPQGTIKTLFHISAKDMAFLLRGVEKALNCSLDIDDILRKEANVAAEEQQRLAMKQAEEEKIQAEQRQAEYFAKQAQKAAKKAEEMEKYLERKRLPPQRSSMESELREELRFVYRTGVVTTNGRPDMPFSAFVAENDILSLVERQEDGRVVMRAERIRALPVENFHAERQIVAKITEVALRNNVLDVEAIRLLKPYKLYALKKGNSMEIGTSPHRATIDPDSMMRSYSGQVNRDDAILGQRIPEGNSRKPSRPLTDGRRRSVSDDADRTGWNRFPEAADDLPIFDRGNGRSSLEERLKERPVKRGGGKRLSSHTERAEASKPLPGEQQER